jgi:hypothetical protein
VQNAGEPAIALAGLTLTKRVRNCQRSVREVFASIKEKGPGEVLTIRVSGWVKDLRIR